MRIADETRPALAADDRAASLESPGSRKRVKPSRETLSVRGKRGQLGFAFHA